MESLPLSVVYLIKNESEFLERSLLSVASIASEILVADTGSTDGSLEILTRLQKKISHLKIQNLKWSDDFSQARNQIAEQARQPWIFFVDGDEILDESHFSKLKTVLAQDEFSCVSVLQRNYTQDESLENLSLVTESYDFLGEGRFYSFDNWMERLYRNHQGLKYEGRIHESLLPSCHRLGLKSQKIPIVLHHFGRLKKNQNAEAKANYYLGLSELKWKEEQNNAAAWIEYITILIQKKEFAKALRLAKEATRLFDNEPEVLKVHFQTALRAEQYQLAETSINRFLKLKPNDEYALSQKTTSLLYQGKMDEAQNLCQGILQLSPENFVSHLNLGVIHFERQNWFEAELHLRKALAVKPSDTFIQSALRKLESKMN